ncbi:class I SAM-dependent methyltransferase [Pleurocapsales cyanobacterium LEGE 10410]|nr:class I SAM-dependent methyltransferase [Pleurocapsales cyanobacterium LEGE 10410]
MTENQSKVQELAQKSFARNDPTGWFEELYSTAQGKESAIPWAKLKVNPDLATWIEKQNLLGQGKNALVVGCGLGDDAEALAKLGFGVTGFDISSTAIAWCQQRFPNSEVNYLVDDLLQPTKVNQHKFDFILESYTLQALPSSVRPQGMKTISQLIAPGGRLLVICRGRDLDEPATELPFPLTKAELAYFEALGLKQIEFEDYLKQEETYTRRFRIEYTLANEK